MYFLFSYFEQKHEDFVVYNQHQSDLHQQKINALQEQVYSLNKLLEKQTIPQSEVYLTPELFGFLVKIIVPITIIILFIFWVNYQLSLYSIPAFFSKITGICLVDLHYFYSSFFPEKWVNLWFSKSSYFNREFSGTDCFGNSIKLIGDGDNTISLFVKLKEDHEYQLIENVAKTIELALKSSNEIKRVQILKGSHTLSEVTGDYSSIIPSDIISKESGLGDSLVTAVIDRCKDTGSNSVVKLLETVAKESDSFLTNSEEIPQSNILSGIQPSLDKNYDVIPQDIMFHQIYETVNLVDFFLNFTVNKFDVSLEISAQYLLFLNNL